MSKLALLLVFLPLFCNVKASTTSLRERDGSYISKIVTISLSGGLPSCSSCGGVAGGYACSNNVGNWNNGIFTFTDPAPRKSILAAVNVTLLGSFSCETRSPMSVSVSLQNTVIDSKMLEGTAERCKCGTCDGERFFLNDVYEAGWPQYHYGGKNTLQVITQKDNVICLSEISLNLTYWIGTTYPTEYVHVNLTGGSDQCSVCGAASKYFCTNQLEMKEAKFIDPLPEGAILTSAYANVFGQFVGWYSKPLLVATLGNAQIGHEGKPSISPFHDFRCGVCDGGTSFVSDNSYQEGWPGYKYGKENMLALNLYKSGAPDYWCVGYVQLVLEYRLQ